MTKISPARTIKQTTRSGLTSVAVLAVMIVILLTAFVLVQVKGRDDGPLSPSSAIAEVSAVHSPAVRIATLLPFAADQLIAMGVTPVCVPGLRGQAPAEWENIPTVQLDHSAGPNLEQLIAVSPDYIVTGSVYAQFMPKIESITEAKIIMMDVDSVASIMEHVSTLGEISGRTAESKALVAELESDIDAPASVQEGEQIDVLAIFGTPHSFYAVLPDSYLGDLVSHAGGRMGPEGLESHRIYRGLAPLSMETVIEFDPDLLLVLFHGPEDSSRAMFEGDPLWGSLRAVHDGRVFFLADDLYAMRPGSRVREAMSEIRGYVETVAVRAP
ncbi:MAG: ABC transporter substrate-binding protein [Phycisphaerales bacterium]|nr:ABC transporter substrate-binding protein [Phycisphaerales bacterium]